ncbi:hypothetical protein AM500_02415 [Bacillus sp. FJAT-18017]|uniref:YigZ family protein n=1 Tax=Bacillus sp. FJAT-18017 TaxID=1705566 RepID=UPI0006B031D9|nr:YigZ family protein [Bacillus sp. FJAT-18017]ALC88778.1 hypothetical protein AM500_02415 [Bacillus sp. FJAT-18017]
MLPSYLTVKDYGEHEIIIERSRFIAHVQRAETEEQAQEFIADIKRRHRDATHNCSAYLIGETDHIQKANDDGEPSGTAGVPILEVLKKKKLKDTVIVVTRYFGGIKLGAGGLIRAYGRSASEGINTTGIVERRLMRVVHTTIDYTLLGKIENELRSSGAHIRNIHYLDKVEIETLVEDNETAPFMERMVDLANGQCDCRLGEVLYVEFER